MGDTRLKLNPALIEAARQAQAQIDRLRDMGILVEEDQTAAEPDPPGAPPRDADADAWLDWRDKEKRAGRWWRLEQIAKWSDHTIAQLKYKSSLRKPRGTPKPNPEKRKKLKKLTE